MTLFQIAINNLRRRKSKMVFVVLGLAIGIATIVSVFNVVESMREQMTRQMADFGANIVITPDTGELAFSYGGITIPPTLFDVEQLTMVDVDKINELPARQMVRAVAPKLLGVASSGARHVIISGSDLQSEFAIKPWLRLQQSGEMGEASPSPKDMDYEKLNLAREDISAVSLTDGEVLLGATIAEELGVMPGDTLEIAGMEFQVFAVLAENASTEDNQVMMNLAVSQRILQRPGEVTVIELSADYSLGSEDALLDQLNGALPHAEVISLRQAALGRDEMVTRLTRFGASVSILVLFVGMLTVAITMSGAVRERTREIGIFRAIGFRKSHVATIILIEGAVVSLLGGAVGYVAGLAAARGAGPFLSGMEIAVPWSTGLFLAAMLLAVIIGVLASLYPARQASRLDPAEALRFM